MTIVDTLPAAADVAAPEPILYRLHNPWTVPLTVSATIAFLAFAGALAAAATEQVRLAWSAAAVLAAVALYFGVLGLHTRYQRRAPKSAFRPVAK